MKIGIIVNPRVWYQMVQKLQCHQKWMTHQQTHTVSLLVLDHILDNDKAVIV